MDDFSVCSINPFVIYLEEFMWDISRTKPGGEHVGKAVPIFIDNWHHHYATIKAFDDGAIDVWGFLDLELFDKKLQTGWVSMSPPNDSRLSIFNLGMVTVSNGEWTGSVCEVRDLVWGIVRDFDPTLENVVDMEGADTRTKGKVRYAKMGLSDSCPYRTDEQGEKILGQELPLFERDGQDYILRHWFIYSDETSRVGFDGELVSFEKTCDEIENGSLVTSAAEANWINIPTIGRIVANEGSWFVSTDQRILEARDILNKLQGGDGAIERCLTAFRQYEDSPNSENKTALKSAYESVPDHLKMYCGDMDSKDWPIRRILYPDDEG